jgi:choice-of-anchor B domain-containing protein
MAPDRIRAGSVEHRRKPMTLQKRIPVAIALVAGLTLVSRAHEDDPKLQDFQAPYVGPAYRTGLPGVYAPATAGVKGSGGGGAIKQTVVGTNFPSSGVTLLSWLPTSEFGQAVNGNSCWGYTSPSGREYALMGLENKTAIVEITDPGNPVTVKKILGPNSPWRNIKVYQDHAYSVSEGGDGIQVIDLSQIDNGQAALVNTITTGGTPATHTSWINEDTGYLYRAGGDNHGLRIYDLSTPSNPVHVATWDDRYVHAVTTFLYTAGPWAGKEIAFACGGFNGGFSSTGVSILDVTDKGNIKVLKHKGYSNPGYSHQAFPSEDKQYLYLSDEADENGVINTRTIVFDISNLSNPIERPSFSNNSTAVSHNYFVKGDLLFEANYRSGLRVFDKTNQTQPTEIAYFDTWPEDDKASFNGLWNTFPFFPSGVVIGSDVEKGLFVWWVGAPLVTVTIPGGAPDLFDPTGATLTVNLAEQNPGDLVPGTEQFHYDTGAGWTTTALVDVGGGNYEATIPARACGSSINYYFTARSTNGVTWTEPAGGPNVFYSSSYAVARAVAVHEDMESNPGWSLAKGSDDATTGRWEYGNPIGTVAQPEDDVTDPGKRCYFTENANGQFVAGVADVDGGKTTLTSTAYDLTGMSDPWISYWRWYSNGKGFAPHEDVLLVEVSNQGGQNGTWVTVETVGPDGPDTKGGWIRHQFRVADFVAPTSNVTVRFIASDYNTDSLVEAAIDELEVVDIDCGTIAPTAYCTAGTSASGCRAALSASGTPSASAVSGFDLIASGLEGAKDGLYFFGTNGRQANSWGSSTSYQCVVPPVIRAGLLTGTGTPGTCDGIFTQDLNGLWCSTCPSPLKNPGAGAVVQAQLWYRDPLNTSNQTTSLSDAMEFTVTP